MLVVVQKKTFFVMLQWYLANKELILFVFQQIKDAYVFSINSIELYKKERKCKSKCS